MEDIFVDIDDEVCDMNDEFIDVSDVEVGQTFFDEDTPKRRVIRHDYYGRITNPNPSDHVSFRYSRYDRYVCGNTIHNPVTEMFSQVQETIDAIVASDMSRSEKRAAMTEVMNRFKQYLRNKNIRYRNSWRNINTHDIIKYQIW